MKNILIISLVLGSLTTLFSQKKDIQAWKSEKSIEAQHQVFVENASYWDGYFMFKKPQLDDYYKALVDSVTKLEQRISEGNNKITALKAEVISVTKQYKTSEETLNRSLSNESSLTTLGIAFDKNSFPTIMYTIIIILFLICAIGFGLFFRSSVVTKEALKIQKGLQEDLSKQQKRALERETKLNRALQTERNKRA